MGISWIHLDNLLLMKKLSQLNSVFGLEFFFFANPVSKEAVEIVKDVISPLLLFMVFLNKVLISDNEISGAI